MNDFIISMLCAVGCALLWGISYSSLQPVSAVLRSETISVVYSFVVMIVSMIIILSKNGGLDDFKLLTWSLGGYLAGYVILSLVALYVYLAGYKLAGSNYAGGFNAISSTYPAIVFIISYTFFKQRDFNLYLAIPGVLLIVTGIVLISLAPITKT